ncbi:MAG: exo-alpha-sialidase [Chloroflexi bacterium]|nr:exo-alpha-sialidase [Chloroflexota bacterium]
MANPIISIASTGLVYHNPKPYLRSQHAYHPSLVLLADGELICTFDLGQAVEALDYRTYLSRSSDGGQSWEFQGPLLPTHVGRPATSSVRTSGLSDGRLVGFGGRFYRDDPEQGLVNRETLGYVPMDLILTRSDNRGRSWSPAQEIQPPLAGPGFEICHRIVELPGGRWLAPVSTWRGWHGEAPSGEKTVVLISEDQGQSWPEYGVIFDGTAGGVIHWEVSVVSLGGERLLAVVWAHDPTEGKNLPTPFALSEDGGKSFSPAKATGLRGQTCKALCLQGAEEGGAAQILCVYRRDDRPGLWANLARLNGNEWTNLAELPLWGAQMASSGMAGQTNSAEELSSLKFGYPSMVQVSADEVLLVFWCWEDCISNIRWIRLRVS